MVICVELVSVAACETPVTVTVEDARKPVPLITRVIGPDPAAADEGESPVIAGAGLSVDETVKLKGCDTPPPGAGFVTISGSVPRVLRSDAVRNTLS